MADLPGPATFEHAVLVQPWPLAVGLVLGGAVGLVLMAQRGRTGLGLALGGAGLLLAAGVVLAANLVETTGERVSALARELIGACAKIDEPAILRLTSSDVALEIPVLASGAAQSELIRLLHDELGRYPITGHEVTRMSWSVDGANLARTRCRVIVDPEARALPVSVWVTMTWRLGAGDTWKARTIRAESAERGE